MTLHLIVLSSLLTAYGGPLVNSDDTNTALTNMADMDSALVNTVDMKSELTNMSTGEPTLGNMAVEESTLGNMATEEPMLCNMANWDISNLSGGFLVDVSYEKHDSGAEIVILRTIGPSSGADRRKPFPRDEVSIIVQGKKGTIVFSSSIPWQKTGEFTARGEATYSARLLVYPETIDLLLSDLQNACKNGGGVVGDVSFESLFK